MEKGALRAYVLDEQGEEHITTFALEGWTMGDLYSFIKEEPATLNIDALEDCELTLITKQAYNQLLQKLPKFETYMRLLITDAYMALQRRTNTSATSFIPVLHSSTLHASIRFICTAVHPLASSCVRGGSYPFINLP